MTRYLVLLLFLGVAAASAAPAAAAKKVTVKMATLAPDGSAWDKYLNEMSSEWKSETDGRIHVNRDGDQIAEPHAIARLIRERDRFSRRQLRCEDE